MLICDRCGGTKDVQQYDQIPNGMWELDAPWLRDNDVMYGRKDLCADCRDAWEKLIVKTGIEFMKGAQNDD